MTAKRHSADDRYLDAAHDCILAVGVRRTSLTDVARRAGVSRMTLYRRWPDMQTLFADLMTREWLAMTDDAFAAAPPGASTASQLAHVVTETVAAFRANPLFAKILDVDPELLLPYLLARRGRSQDAIIDVLTRALDEGRRDGSVRDVDSAVLSRMVLLVAQGFTLSAPTMADATTLDQLRAELALLLERYLAP